MNEGTVVKRMNAGSWNYARARGGALSCSVWYQITRKFDTGNPAGLRQRTEGHKFGSWHWNEICPSNCVKPLLSGMLTALQEEEQA